jgi:heme exporter protein D
MADYLAMGGYAAFVWPAYSLSVIVLAGLVVWTLWANRRARDMLRRMETQGKDT